MDYTQQEIEEIRSFCCMCWGISFVISLLLLVVVSIMSNRAGMNTVAWMVIVFLGGIFGFIVFLIAAYVHMADERGGNRSRGDLRGRYDPGDYHTTGYKARGPTPGTFPAPDQSASGADPNFRDYTLDDLLEDGKLSEARKYVDDMCRMAKEMGDDKGYRNYKSYESKIHQAAMRPPRNKD